MAKKKGVTRKTVKKVASRKTTKRSSKDTPKRKATLKGSSSIKKSSTNPEHIRITQKKIEKATKSLIYSIISFVLFAILTSVVNKVTLKAVFELGMIISGALVLLFILLEIIYYFMKKR